jgi:hypothetical protein
MTLKEHEYHIGTSNHVNISKVVVYTMCRNAKKKLQKEGVEMGI